MKTMHTLGAEAAHDGEDLLHLATVERRGRLVEDQDLGMAAHGLGELDQLAIGEREIAHHGAGIDPMKPRPTSQAPASRLIRLPSTSPVWCAAPRP